MIQSSATTTTPAAAPPPASSSSPSSSTAAAAVASSSICPICHCCIPHTAEFNQHINICLGLTPATTTAPANAAATTAPTTTDSGDAIVNVASSIASQMSLLHSLLSSHTTNSALLQQQDVQQQLRQLEQMYAQHQTQLHQLLIQTARGVTPFAAVAPVTSHSVPSSSSSITAAVDNSGMSDGEGKEEEEEKHVLSATDAAQSRKCSYPSLTPPDEGSSSSSNSRAPAVSNFKRHADDHASSSAAVHMYPSVSASSSSSSSSAAASSSSSFFPGDDDDAMVDDEAFVRRLQAEEDARAAAAVLQRKQREEAEFAEFLRREGSCASCGRTVPETETLESFLIPIGEERTNTTAAAAGETNSCEHKVCRDCLAQYLHQQMQRLQAPSSSSLAVPAKSLTEADLLCPVTGCRTRLSQWQMKRVLSAAEFETLLSYTLRNTLSSAAAAAGGTYVECPNSACKSVFLAEAGNEANIASISGELGIDGRPLSSAAKKHRAQNRFRCRECGTVFCGGCRHTPYHDGFDCEGYAAYVSGKKCRFCQTGLNASNTAPATMTQPQSTGAAAVLNNLIGSVSGFFGGSSSSSYAAAASSSPAAPVPAPPALLNVCNSAECLEKRASSCEKTLACGHNCCGIRGERQCLPCLEEECSFHKVADPGVTADDYCNICFTEGIGQAPAIQLKCGHFFHFACIRTRIERKWPGSRIIFTFLGCPLCKQELSHPALKPILAPYLKLQQEVRAKAVQRLAFEGMDNDPAFTTRSGKYYGRKEEYALDRFAYYMCYQCKQPYFGGRRQCEEVAMANPNEQFKESELVCGGCAAGSDLNKCAKHGKEFIDYKCKFCCNIASWYCWGSTHFCNDCHKKQESGVYVSKLPASDLPKCGGVGKCPLGIKHPPNGQEFVLGCAICRPRDS